MSEAISPSARQTWAVSAVLLNVMGHGMVLSFPSVLLPGLKADDSIISTDPDTMSWLASVVGLATFPGYLFSAWCMDVWGRKVTQALVVLLGALGWLLVCLAADVPALMAGRILGGVSYGASTILGVIVIAEYTSPKLRGIFLSLKIAAAFSGNTFVHIVGHYYSWKTVAIFGLTSHIIAFVIVCTWPESPVWLAVSKNFDQSEKMWIRLRGDGATSVIEFHRMIRAQKLRLAEIHEKPGIKTHVINILQKFIKKDFLKPLIIVFFAVMLKEACGKHIFPAYALQITEDITGDKSSSFYYTLAIDLTITLSAAFSSALARLMNRRTLLFGTGGAACLILTGICSYLYMSAIDVISRDRAWLPISMFMLYFVLTNLGCTVIPLALLGEVFPVAHKAAGSAMSGLAMSVCLVVVLKVTPTLLVAVKVYGTFGIYGATMAGCLLVLYFTLPETKDRTLQEIEDYFNHGRFINDGKIHEDGEDTYL
ncbi:facilitated trehalose transporter Tret1-like [Cydia splendana]|uniref:facilitated trehalose transporter Tret1-like n=1 Tax=Cydia splendana TaxID=1100963 RepID=UPI00300D9C72